MLFSLFGKRTTRAGAIAGMLGGAGMVFVWNLLVRPLGGIWDKMCIRDREKGMSSEQAQMEAFAEVFQKKQEGND